MHAEDLSVVNGLPDLTPRWTVQLAFVVPCMVECPGERTVALSKRHIRVDLVAKHLTGLIFTFHMRKVSPKFSRLCRASLPSQARWTPFARGGAGI